MRAAVIRFPGSNCDQDCHIALRESGFSPTYIWHKETTLGDCDLIVLPGGFSYGDYLRCGAIARFSPIMQSITEHAKRGVLIMGICNGFQILCESGLLPGALIRNRNLHFLCKPVHLRVENTDTPFLSAATAGDILRIPIAHGEGSYTADPRTLAMLNSEGRVLLRYCTENGKISPEANPNGSLENIAGICNTSRNIFGLMPHPERACDSRLGSTDGNILLHSIRSALEITTA